VNGVPMQALEERPKKIAPATLPKSVMCPPNTPNFIPTLRAPHNPVQHAYRSTVLVRCPHPYALVIDDLDKDGQTHLYQWCAILGPGVWQVQNSTLPWHQALLGWDGSDKRNHAGLEFLYPEKGEPLLLVCALGLPEPQPASQNQLGVKAMEVCPVVTMGRTNNSRPQTFYDTLCAGFTGVQARFRMLFIPVRVGEPLPAIDYNAAEARAIITWPEAKDVIAFEVGADNRTRMTINRGGQKIMETP